MLLILLIQVACSARISISDSLMNIWVLNKDYSFLLISQGYISAALALFLLECFSVTRKVCTKPKKLSCKLSEFRVILHIWNSTCSCGKITTSLFFELCFKSWIWEASDCEYRILFHVIPFVNVHKFVSIPFSSLGSRFPFNYWVHQIDACALRDPG